MFNKFFFILYCNLYYKSEDSSNNSLNSSILDATANSSEYSTVTEVNKNIERVNNNYYEFTDLIDFRMRHEESSYLETYFKLYCRLVRNVIIIIFKVIGQQVASLDAGCCASRSTNSKISRAWSLQRDVVQGMELKMLFIVSFSEFIIPCI